ncbi:deoxyribonuclease 1 like 1 [Rhinolophus ferrumequinum]|uniref:Deoxyribonuclease 1 like 1 n=1 Tax=Rhinolophus ferrumequinum TaxID=59479 RepID=A0A7J8ATP0_RHIFE|nr:deoxyribonuclease 1 like 1 [Rhinolophus ferrumequinum]
MPAARTQPAMHCPATLLLLLLAGGAEAFRICAFNAQRLTLAKVAREHVLDTLVRALNISDHYPVEVELSRAAHKIQPLSLAALLLPSLLLPLLPPELGLVA